MKVLIISFVLLPLVTVNAGKPTISSLRPKQEVDYSKCANFINNHYYLGSAESNFKLLPDGRVQVSGEKIVSFNDVPDKERKMRTDIFIETSSRGKGWDDRWQKIYRDSNLNIEKVELVYDATTNPYIVTLYFEIRNNQCVFVKETTKNPVIDEMVGEKLEVTDSILDLCKDIHDFFNDTPSAKGCFDERLNKKMEAIFHKHIPKDSINRKLVNVKNSSQFSRLYRRPNERYSEYHLNSLEITIARSSKADTGERLYSRSTDDRKRIGTSPIIGAHKILRGCYFLNLDGIFFNDPKIWQDQSASVGVGSLPESEGKSVIEGQ